MAARRSVLVTGCRGRLGTELMRQLSGDFEMLGVDRNDLDVTDEAKVRSCIRTLRPDIVLHTAAVTDVDACERNPELASRVNDAGTGNVAKACEESHAMLVYYSTDYVFDGQKREPYVETDRPDPVNCYSRSKLAGELTALALCGTTAVMRVAWLYGIHGSNFAKMVIQRAKAQRTACGAGTNAKPIRIIEDQFGTPTWTYEVARQTKVIIGRELSGVFHATADGSASWLEWARLVLDELQLTAEIQPCPAREFWGDVPRPAYSVMRNMRLQSASADIMKPWDAAIREFLAQYKRELLA